MIVIKWYGAFKTKNGQIIDRFIFPREKRAEIIMEIKKGNYNIWGELDDEKIKIVGEINNKNDLIYTAIEVVQKEMKKALGDDYILIESLNTYDDIISIINLMNERLSEWDKIKKIKEKKYEILQMVRKELENLEKLKNETAKNIEILTSNICPNLAYIVGSIIAARLISSAGGLSRLTRLPASTIQVLGAEEAFFRHLKTGTKCPKHGIIFRVPYVRNSPRKIRGKIARSLAAKIAIAAKVDYYKGEFIGDKLKADLEKRVLEVRGNDNNRQKK